MPEIAACEQEYKTKNIEEAACLHAMGQEFVGVAKDVDGKFWMKFKNPEICLDIVRAFWIGKLQVGAKILCDSIRVMKERLYYLKNIN